MEALFQNFTAEFTNRHVYLRGKKYLLGALCVEMLRHSELVEKGEAFLPEAQALEFEVRRGAFTSNDLDTIRTYIFDILKVYRELKPLQMFQTPEQIDNLNEIFNEDIRTVLQSVEEKPFMESEEAWERRFPFVKYPAYQTCYENTVRALIHISRMLLGLPMDFRFLFNHIHPIADAYSCDEKHTTEMLLRSVINDLKANAASSLLSYTEIQTSKGKTEIGRRICFETYLDLVFTDFYEGLRCGHYPRKCIVCSKYFLVTSGHEQKICNGYSGFRPKNGGRMYSCKQYAALKYKTRAEKDSPVTKIYTTRRGGIRQDVNRGNITEEFAEHAKLLAEEKRDRARRDPEYANGQYEKEMRKRPFYAEVERRMQAQREG